MFIVPVRTDLDAQTANLSTLKQLWVSDLQPKRQNAQDAQEGPPSRRNAEDDHSVPSHRVRLTVRDTFPPHILKRAFEPLRDHCQKVPVWVWR
jgi:hypothetical protein